MASGNEKLRVLKMASDLTKAEERSTLYISRYIMRKEQDDFDIDELNKLERDVDSKLKDLINFCVNVGSDN